MLEGKKAKTGRSSMEHGSSKGGELAQMVLSLPSHTHGSMYAVCDIPCGTIADGFKILRYELR